MGEVYRALDTKLNRDVSLKILPQALATDPDRLARFHRKAQVLASLNHPTIGQSYGFEDSGATHAPVLELIDGPTLAEMIAGGAIDGAPGLPPSLKLRRTRRSLGGGGQARGTIPGAKAPGLHLNDALPIARQSSLPNR